MRGCWSQSQTTQGEGRAQTTYRANQCHSTTPPFRSIWTNEQPKSKAMINTMDHFSFKTSLKPIAILLFQVIDKSTFHQIKPLTVASSNSFLHCSIWVGSWLHNWDVLYFFLFEPKSFMWQQAKPPISLVAYPAEWGCFVVIFYQTPMLTSNWVHPMETALQRSGSSTLLFTLAVWVILIKLNLFFSPPQMLT